jgi:hypothetical protein
MQTATEFTLLVEERSRVLLARWGRSFTREGLQALFAAIRPFAATHGDWAGIIDFSQVDDIGIDVAFARALGQRPRVLPGARRVLVAPQPQLFGMLRLYGLHQAGISDEPMVVRTLEEAYAQLGLRDPDFRPLEPG